MFETEITPVSMQSRGHIGRVLVAYLCFNELKCRYPTDSKRNGSKSLTGYANTFRIDILFYLSLNYVTRSAELQARAVAYKNLKAEMLVKLMI
jgi:hypothetical protein